MSEPSDFSPPSTFAIEKIDETWANQIGQSIENNIGLFSNQAPRKRKIQFRDWFQQNKESEIFNVKTELLRFRPDSGRIKSAIKSLEIMNGPVTNIIESQDVIREALSDNDADNERLRQLIISDGQRDPVIITADGWLIDGNRRKFVLELLQEEFPSDHNYQYIQVVVLPGNKYLEEKYGENKFFDFNPPSKKDILRCESKYQIEDDGKSDYSELNTTITQRDYINDNYSLEEQLDDNAAYPASGNTRTQELNRLMKNQKVLGVCDQYLILINAPSQYNLIQNEFWTPIKDFTNIVINRIEKEDWRLQHNVKPDDLHPISKAVFSLIRSNPSGSLHAVVSKKIPKILENEKSRKKLLLFSKEIEKNEIFIKLLEPVSVEEGEEFKEKLIERENNFKNEFSDTTEKIIEQCHEIATGYNQKTKPIENLEKAVDLISESLNQKRQIDVIDRILSCYELFDEIDQALYDFRDYLGKKKFELDKQSKQLNDKFPNPYDKSN